jgi:hypothetical protein
VRGESRLGRGAADDAKTFVPRFIAVVPRGDTVTRAGHWRNGNFWDMLVQSVPGARRRERGMLGLFSLKGQAAGSSPSGGGSGVGGPERHLPPEKLSSGTVFGHFSKRAFDASPPDNTTGWGASAPDKHFAHSGAVCPPEQPHNARRPAWAFQAGRPKQMRGDMAAAEHAPNGMCACCVKPQVRPPLPCCERAPRANVQMPALPALGGGPRRRSGPSVACTRSLLPSELV